MIRKHVKVEPARWYYHCDKLGMIVWQDMPNGGSDYQHWFVTYLATLLNWARIPVKDVHARYMIYRIDGQLCSGSSTKIDRLDAFDLDKDGKIVIEFDSMTLTRSQYWVDIVLEKADGTPIDYYKEAVRFNVVSGIEDMGVARIEHTWKNC